MVTPRISNILNDAMDLYLVTVNVNEQLYLRTINSKLIELQIDLGMQHSLVRIIFSIVKIDIIDSFLVLS